MAGGGEPKSPPPQKPGGSYSLQRLEQSQNEAGEGWGRDLLLVCSRRSGSQGVGEIGFDSLLSEEMPFQDGPRILVLCWWWGQGGEYTLPHHHLPSSHPTPVVTPTLSR